MQPYFWMFVIFIFIYTVYSADYIQEPQTYGPKVTPSNIPGARSALGYDKYEKQPVESSKRTSRKFRPYGNNWEQFDVPEVTYNFGFNG